MVITFLENALNPGIFTHAPVLHSKLQVKLFENLFEKQKGVEKTMIWFIKFQSEIVTMTWNVRLFMFYMICNFYKCDGFTV